MREKFKDINFHGSSLKIIEQAIEIIDDLRAKGYTLTLRQLYYQFVRRNWIVNSEQSYKRLGSIINDARLAGMIDWNAIEDRTRYLRRIPDYDDPANFIKSVVGQYAENLWRNLDVYCEVWIEKDALIGVIENPCDQWRVPYFSCRGYGSQSEMYEAGQRLKSHLDDGKSVTVLHLGDHDPSGLDMTRDIQERLDMFCNDAGDVVVDRIALNMEQIRRYNPPPNPAKTTDSRHAEYMAVHGRESWELDALDPEVIAQLVDTNIRGILGFQGEEMFKLDEKRERNNRTTLYNVVEHWQGLVNHMNGGIKPIV